MSEKRKNISPDDIREMILEGIEEQNRKHSEPSVRIAARIISKIASGQFSPGWQGKGWIEVELFRLFPPFRSESCDISVLQGILKRYGFEGVQYYQSGWLHEQFYVEFTDMPKEAQS